MAKKQKEQKAAVETRIWLVEKKGKFLTGVFNTTSALNKFLAASRKNEMDKDQITKMAQCREFPVYILSHEGEGEKAFMCFDSEKSAQEKYESEKWEKGVIFIVAENFSSPGKDGTSKLQKITL